MSKVDDKKKKIARKMRKETIEGDQDDGALTKFNKKDIKKEKKARTERNGEEPKASWQI